ncbi:glutamine--fructose-6-phosphate transaminase (isomerizing) [Synechococcus sp. RSCCF101]|uniref:glutamine--fructose-6-phosphate transaminase (isomerizing) n=1 Tax=Synechococcus sp. RSCCF101 TaxID=2511069 RepID=UPI0012465181|nr:glutamine--fructose-6-phosphate transaminase (isomerizing) [Synechococcus sp. RSCCF101]QEY33471.1 glutamine--fructose-6-phosphate transaminase (isomerizing) [Synechococcus sp. RSCCF101]
MCGIVAVIGSREAAPLLLEGLRQLEYRGYDSAGLATVRRGDEGGGQLQCLRSKGKLNNLTARFEREGAAGHCGIGHTRWATHGKPEEHNAHPHLDQAGHVAVVQNGIIENHRALRDELEAEGVAFRSETDTEVIPHLIARALRRWRESHPAASADGATLLQAVRSVLPLLEGAYALAVIWSELPSGLVVARRQAPLLIGLGEGEFLCASDTPALAGVTRTILPMDDGEVALLTPLGIELYDSGGARLQRAPTLLSGADHVADKRSFRHFMLKEIHEQPETCALWVARHLPGPGASPAGGGPGPLVALPLDPGLFEGVERVQILACGTSRHAAMVGAHLLEALAGLPTAVFHASEFRYAPPPLERHTLTIGVTQSGETADTLAALAMEAERRAAHPDPAQAARLLGITNRAESSLARQVPHLLDIGAGIEVGVAATKTFLGQLLSFYALALHLAERRGSVPRQRLEQLSEGLRALPDRLTALVRDHDRRCEDLAHLFAETRDVIFLGRGINYPIALEGALKLKEISYIHAEGYPAGEMKHGPIALLDSHVPVVSIAMPGRVFDKVLSNAQEAKARDARLIGVAPEGPDTALFDVLLPVPEVDELLSPLLSVIPMQLLSYHIAAHRGLDVDQPRNLAKSVTVE